MKLPTGDRNARNKMTLQFRFLRVVLFMAALVGGWPSVAQVPDPVYLWPAGAPGSDGKFVPESVRITEQGEHVISSIHRPSILPYLPPKGTATGAAVLVIPGGGHRELWMDHEGYNVAAWLSHHGVTAFVLKYRLAGEAGSSYTVEGTELSDVQRALRLIRSHSAEWGVDPNRIGIMGFSAGGELAALAGTHFADGKSDAADPIERESSRPAFQALIYPAIPKDIVLTKATPPAFLACGEEDRPDIAQGVPELYLALRRAGVSAELHVFSKTGHGFGLRESNHGPSAAWISLFYEWMNAQGLRSVVK
jgi:acetyl esterase/lipase